MQPSTAIFGLSISASSLADFAKTLSRKLGEGEEIRVDPVVLATLERGAFGSWKEGLLHELEGGSSCWSVELDTQLGRYAIIARAR